MFNTSRNKIRGQMPQGSTRNPCSAHQILKSFDHSQVVLMLVHQITLRFQVTTLKAKLLLSILLNVNVVFCCCDACMLLQQKKVIQEHDIILEIIIELVQVQKLISIDVLNYGNRVQNKEMLMHNSVQLLYIDHILDAYVP